MTGKTAQALVFAVPPSIPFLTEEQDTIDGVTIIREEFSQIALLQPEMLNRCQEGIEEARALLGLVLCHVAPHDLAWQEERIVKGRKSGEDVEQDKRAPSLTSLARFADELGVTIDYLVTGKEGVITDTIPAIKADKRLSTDAKKALITTVRALYGEIKES